LTYPPRLTAVLLCAWFTLACTPSLREVAESWTEPAAASAGSAAGLERLSQTTVSLTPDGDGVDDVVQIAFGLEITTRVSRYVLDQQGQRIDQVALDEPRIAGGHRVEWNGMVGSRPVAPGSYRYVVEGKDGLGGSRTIETEVLVRPYQFPVGRLIHLEITPTSGRPGDLVQMHGRVRNTGPAPMRAGDWTSAGLGSSLTDGLIVERGTWWVAVGWADLQHAGNREFWRPGGGGLMNRGLSLAERYPSRWGLGRSLVPDEETEVSGTLRLPDRPGRWWLYSGLIHEGFTVHDDGVSSIRVEVLP
jgi:hypothetical protein